MFTYLGKILALANLAISVMAMAGAMMFYYNRIDWTEGPSKEKPGQLRARVDRVKDLWSAMVPADAGWRSARAELNEQEGYRREDRDWYVLQLKHNQSLATANDPARNVVYTNDGALSLVPAAADQPKHLRPQMNPVEVVVDKEVKQKLASLDSYLKAAKDTHDNLAQVQGQINDAVEDDKRLTNLLVPEEGKGLRQRIVDERVKIVQIEEERSLVRPILVNTSVESVYILNRRAELKARVDELEKKAGLAEARKP